MSNSRLAARTQARSQRGGPLPMQAFILDRYGDARHTHLATMPTPEPAPGQMLVRVCAAWLNVVDFKAREGKLKVNRRYPLPAVKGNALAGTLQALSPGMNRIAPGDLILASGKPMHRACPATASAAAAAC